jgi:hypothetical protein
MAKAGRKKVLEGTIRPGWFAPAVVFMGVAAVAGAVGGYDGLGKDPPSAVIGYGGSALLAVAVVALLLLNLAAKQAIRIDLGGLVVRRGLGKPVEIRWSEEHSYFYRAYTGASTPAVVTATVTTPDGRRIDIDDLKLPNHPNASLPALVEKYSTEANLPKIKRRLEAGEEVELGAVTLTSEHICIGDERHELQAGAVLQIDKGLIQLGSAGKWFPSQVPVREVPNYPCLLRAIGQITHARSPG